MKMIIGEVTESLGQRKTFTLFIVLQLTLFYFAATALLLHYVQIGEKSEPVESLKTMTDYQLSDSLLEDGDLKRFMRSPVFLESMKRFYRLLDEDEVVDYVYLFNQSMAIIPTGKWDEKFLYGYENGRTGKSFSINDKGPFYAVKAVQMNRQAFDSYAIQTVEGEAFVPNDYINREGEAIPVLLGAEYEDIYRPGDRITANYLMKDFELVVKGFLQPDTMVYNTQFPELYLDRYIVMPAQSFAAPGNDEELSFQQKHYLQLVNGHIFSTQNEFAIRSKVEELKNISGFRETGLIGAGKLPLHFMASALQINKQWLAVVAVVIFVVTIITISLLMITKLQDRLRSLSVHLLCGASLSQLFSYFLAELLVIVGTPGLLAALVYKWTIDAAFGPYALMVASCTIALTVLSGAPVYFALKRMGISTWLRRTE